MQRGHVFSHKASLGTNSASECRADERFRGKSRIVRHAILQENANKAGKRQRELARPEGYVSASAPKKFSWE